MLKKILSKEEFDKEIKGDKVLVDFSAKWCGPCRMLEPILEELSSSYHIVSVDVDENSSIAEEYGIMTIPTLILFTDSKIVKRESGFRPKEEVKAIIEE